MAHHLHSQDIEFGFSRWPTAFAGLTMILLCLAAVAAGIAAGVYVIREDVGLGMRIWAVCLLPIFLVSGGTCVYIAWLLAQGVRNTTRERVRACSDGIELNATGTKRVLWTEIARFEKGGVKIDSEGNSFVTPVMVLQTGDRLELQALSRASFFGSWQGHVETGERVQALNQLLEQARERPDGRIVPTA